MMKLISPIILLLLATMPAQACHHYSQWYYPYPQPKCGIAAHGADKNWYVEIIQPPLPVLDPFKDSPPQDERTLEQIRESLEHDRAVAEHKDELNTQLRLLHDNE